MLHRLENFRSAKNENTLIEIGAEVFAAEFLLPDKYFTDWLASRNVTRNNFTPEHLVILKNETGTTLSYAGLTKKSEFFELTAKDSLRKMPWRKIEEGIYGIPYYKKIQRKHIKSV
jgi:Zn-dependent peptidase ImmA (M78 family)